MRQPVVARVGEVALAQFLAERGGVGKGSADGSDHTSIIYCLSRASRITIRVSIQLAREQTSASRDV